MPRRHVEAWVDGVALSTVGKVLLQSVTESAPVMEMTQGERPGRAGQYLLSNKRTGLLVSMEVAIWELFDLAKRSSVAEALAAWGNGSILELSSRPGRRLHVALTGAPALGSVRDYTATMHFDFAAYVIPYWEDVGTMTTTLSGPTATGAVSVIGTAPSPVCLTVTPTGGKLTSFSVTIGGQTIALTGLNIARNTEMTFTRDALDNLAVNVGTASQLTHRTAASADDLFVSPGRVSVSHTANTACTVKYITRGRWL